MRSFRAMFVCWIALVGFSQLATAAEQPPTFHPRSARLSDKMEHRFVWRDVCLNNYEDHQMAGGFEWVGDSREFFTIGEAMIRGKRRGGLLMLSFPDGNRLHAEYKVDFDKGQSLGLQYALTDWAASRSTNGLKFSVLATDADGVQHELFEDTLLPGDDKIRDRSLEFDFPVQKLTFVHDNLGREVWDVLWIHPSGLVPPSIPESRWAGQPPTPEETVAVEIGRPHDAQFDALRRAIVHLIDTQAAAYSRGPGFLTRLDELERRASEAMLPERAELIEPFDTLQREALVANPLVSSRPILFVVRNQYRSHYHAIDTLFHTNEFNPDRGVFHAELFQGGGSLKTIDLAENGHVKTLLDVPDGVARDPDVHFDGQKILFAMRRNRDEDYHVYEINTDGSDLTQLTSAWGVSDFDPVYLPDDHILFSSTREPKYNMCSRDIAANLFRMDGDGANIYQITKNTLFDNHAEILPDGRILYARWEYVDRNFGDAHGLWTVNPDGTNQAIYWGNNTAVPGAVFNAHLIPGTQRIVCVLGPHHDRLWGAMGVIDRRLGLDGRPGVVQTWPADAIEPVRSGGAFDCDLHTRTVPLKYEDPWPLSDTTFLCSRMIGDGERTGIYLVDTFGNEVLLHTEGPGCYDPMPLGSRPRPPVIPSRRDFHERDGVFFVADVYQGTHMAGVERGAVKSLRVVESPEKRHWARGSWNGQGYTAPGMNWHSLENKRILGTVRVEADGSAHFSVPADTFVYFQLLDADGMMIQSMRSGTVVQSAERTGCVGCHDERRSAPISLDVETPIALTRAASRLAEWYGPTRTFSYMAEVQPVFTRHCVSCHDYGQEAVEQVNLAADRTIPFNTSYTELWRKALVRCVGGGPAPVQAAYSWGSHASRVMDVIRHGHDDPETEVELSAEEIDRVATWLDLNGVYYGRYACAYPENLTGRCPLDDGQLARLTELTGVPFNQLRSFASNRGPQVSFDRPELSPCLSAFPDSNDPGYREALSILTAGSATLADRPRADMPGFVPCETDLKREEKYAARQAAEQRSREAIRCGEKVYD